MLPASISKRRSRRTQPLTTHNIPRGRAVLDPFSVWHNKHNWSVFMIYLTGDTHGSFERIKHFCSFSKVTKDDVLIILGDAGINYYPGTNRNLKNLLNKLPITLLCIHGNHERRPESIGSYEETKWRNGAAYWEPDFPGLIFAKDGEIYDLDGKQCMAIGGAYSVDKYYRLQRSLPWWPDEQPSDETKQLVEAKLETNNWSIDAMLAHTCPIKYIPREAFLPGIPQDTVDSSTEQWLDTIDEKLNYHRWYCGHFHISKFDRKVQFLFNDIIKLQ